MDDLIRFSLAYRTETRQAGPRNCRCNPKYRVLLQLSTVRTRCIWSTKGEIWSAVAAVYWQRKKKYAAAVLYEPLQHMTFL